jgi:hypothetical protein
MKTKTFIFCAAVLLAACNNQSGSISGSTTDTAVALPEVVKSQADSVEKANKAAASTKALNSKNTNPNVTEDRSTASSSEAMTTESSNDAKKKKGWSKTAKGAVIGGVVGAGTGAAVNKKNRAVGAVVGGVVGAGTGAIIGNELDKKDGRH